MELINNLNILDMEQNGIVLLKILKNSLIYQMEILKLYVLYPLIIFYILTNMTVSLKKIIGQLDGT